MTWENFPQTLSARTFCYEHCICNETRLDSDAGTSVSMMRIGIPGGIYQFLQGRAAGLSGSQGLNLYIQDPMSSSGIKVVPITKRQSGGAQIVMGGCPSNNKRYCPAPWPTEILGVPKPTTVVPPPSPPPDELVELPQCGKGCNSNADCTPSSWESGCRCVAPKTLPSYEPLDPVFPSKPTFPSGRCMSIPKSVLQLASVFSLNG